MSKITPEQVIQEAMSRGAAYASVTASVWNESHECNNIVGIFAGHTKGGELHQGKTLEEAFAKYLAQFTVGTPATETINDMTA